MAWSSLKEVYILFNRMTKLKVHGYAKNWCTFCGGNIYKEKEILCEDCLADVEAEMETRRSINYD